MNGYHWGGSVWDTEDPGLPYVLLGVHGSGPSDVWSVGEGGTAVQWDGLAWTSYTVGTFDDLESVWTGAPDDAWAVGGVSYLAVPGPY